MSERTDKILEQKQYWLEKMHQIVTKMSIASFDNDKQNWEKLLDDFGTAAIIVWRFDRKLDVELDMDDDYEEDEDDDDDDLEEDDEFDDYEDLLA